MSRRLTSLCALGLLLLATACSSGDDEYRETYLIEQQPDIGSLAAALSATVSIVDDCPLISDTLRSDDAELRLQRAAWPNGTRFDPASDVITLPDGRELSDGSNITGGGGSEDFGDEDLRTYDDLFVSDSLSNFAMTCRSDELGITRLYLIAPGGIEIVDD